MIYRKDLDSWEAKMVKAGRTDVIRKLFTEEPTTKPKTKKEK